MTLRSLIRSAPPLLTLVVLAAAARAQSPPPAPPPTPAAPAVDQAQAAQLEEAKRHFQQGVALYNDANYGAALAEFEAAFKIRQSGGVLYNIGLSQKALFRYNEAIQSLVKLLDLDPKMTPERRNEVQQLITEMKALLAEVTLDVTPAGATVLVDGRTVGVTPLVYPLATGQHVVEISAEGYKPLRRELMITAGVPLKIATALVLIPKTAKVTIAVPHAMAQILVDGRPLGVQAVGAGGSVLTELPAGGHQLEVTAPGFNPYRSELVVVAGNDRQLTVELTKTPRKKRVYEQWYFWTPIVLVVGGAIATGLALGLSSTQAPIKGTLDPGAQRVN